MKWFVSIVACFALAPPAVASSPVRPSPVEMDLTDVTISHGATIRRFAQRVAAVPVIESSQVMTDGRGVDAELLIGHPSTGLALGTTPRITQRRAALTAGATLPSATNMETADAELAILPVGRGRLVWRVVVRVEIPRATTEVLVDARTGDVVRTRDLLWRAEGGARVYDPNPVHANQGLGGLADAFDADSTLLTALRTPVTLTRLTAANTCLDGQWARAVLPSGDVCLAGRDFASVTRSDDRFEAVMAYFHVDRAQAYVQELGFANVANRSTRVIANAFAADTSLFDPTTGTIELGAGGTDDGEDADVIVHEYAHALQSDQIPGLATNGQSGALGEGFADYFAAAVAERFSGQSPFAPCIADWDRFGFVPPEPCLRRVDTDLAPAAWAPGTACGADIHCAGQAWSGALWELRRSIGGTTMDRIVIQSHFSLTTTPTFHDASRALLAADAALQGGANAATIRAVLIRRGLLEPERLDDVPADATLLSVPGNATGRVDANSDTRDFYGLDLQAGEGFVLQTSGSGELDVRLLKPDSPSAAQPGAIVAGSTNAGPAERFAFVASAAGRYPLEVSATSGAATYRVVVFSDLDGDTLEDGSDNCPAAANFGQENRDGDAAGDACDRFPDDNANDGDGDGLGVPADNCPTLANADQRDWDGDGAGDACDRSSRITLARARTLGRATVLRSAVLPLAIPRSAWTLTVERRVCDRRSCRFRPVAVAQRVRVIRPGLIEARMVLRPGVYRLRARVSDPRVNPARTQLVITVR